MNAADNNPEELKPQTPVQVLQSFFDNHTINQVQMILLQTLQGYSLNEKKGFLPLTGTEEEITEVFDSLIALVGAVETLMGEGKIKGAG